MTGNHNQESCEILAPVRQLPTEIIGEIFSNLISTDDSEVNYTKPLDRTASPWNIAAVCQQWRAVAVSSPALWSTIRVGPYSEAEDVPGPITQWLQLCLDRSSAHPLNIDLIRAPVQSVSPVKDMHGLLTVVALHASRILKLRFAELVSNDILALEPLRGAMVMLEELSIDIGRDCNGLLVPIDLFGNAPRLARVDIRSSHPQDIPLPWSQLTHFSWYGSSKYGGHMSLDWLKHTPNLHTCKLEAHRPYRYSGNRFVVPSLRSFTVHSSQKYAYTQERILLALSLSGLKEFTFSLHEDAIRHFLNIHNASGFDLTHLSIPHITHSVTQEEWRKLLAATPSLVSLRVAESSRFCAPMDTLVHALQLGEDLSTTLVPVLASLRIGYMNMEDDCGALLQVAVTRSHTSLKELEFNRTIFRSTPPWDSILEQCQEDFVLRVYNTKAG